MWLPIIFGSVLIALVIGWLLRPVATIDKDADIQLSPSKIVQDKEDFDVIFIGAGISGISGAAELKRRCPNKKFVILEGRDSIGGTWDLFRYPGIRSDSDMYTLGYSFRPWASPKIIAEGGDIKSYVKAAAKNQQIDDKISYQKKVTTASFDSDTNKWTLRVIDSTIDPDKQTPIELTCRLVHFCTGYYDYENPYSPHFEGSESFKGQIVHPQFWGTTEVDYKDKNVVVIGSGATAITLIPNLAKQAKHTVMLQRSPSYILALPPNEKFITTVQRILPFRVAYLFLRWFNIIVSSMGYIYCRKFPARAKKALIANVKKQLPKDFDVEKHFTPYYNPWEQRLCVAPNGDIFKAIRHGNVSVETDHIERFVEEGIKLKSGKIIPADLIVTATGLNVKFFGGVKVIVDGKEMKANELVSYKGMMLSNVPNLVFSAGYTNASWTLKCEMTSICMTKIVQHMEKVGATKVVPYLDQTVPFDTTELFDLSSGYLVRAKDDLIKQGPTFPWKNYNSFIRDYWYFTRDTVLDGILRFT